jgi:hypothetical protein
MDRRDFLFRWMRGQERVLELSCERLYMRWADARAGVGGSATAVAVDPSVHDGLQPWEGEPATQVVVATTQDVLGALDHELAGADVLKITESAWLTDPDFGPALRSRVEAFRRRGGRVE